MSTTACAWIVAYAANATAPAPTANESETASILVWPDAAAEDRAVERRRPYDDSVASRRASRGACCNDFERSMVRFLALGASATEADRSIPNFFIITD